MKKNLIPTSVEDAPQTIGRGTSQTIKTQLKLREMILSGELPSGTRIAELAIVEALGVSRTPIRAALVQLEQEGLLKALPTGGYAVASFSEGDIADSIELRGTTEGLLARLSAERGAPALLLAEARATLQVIDALLEQATLPEESFSQYVTANMRFHALIAEMAGSDVIAKQLERMNQQPFTSPSAFVIVQAKEANSRDMLVVAQAQHWQVLDAIERRESARAETVMREHSRIAQRNLRFVIAQHGVSAASSVLGLRLIRRR